MKLNFSSFVFNAFLTVTKGAGGQESGVGKNLLYLMCGFSNVGIVS